MKQLGTLGGDNLFIEVCLDTKNFVWLMLHSGSRNIGKELADRHISTAKLLWKLSEDLIPRGKCYDFNQAIMDFGAMTCTARDPYCLLCPMKSLCKTYPYDGRRGE